MAELCVAALWLDADAALRTVQALARALDLPARALCSRLARRLQCPVNLLISRER